MSGEHTATPEQAAEVLRVARLMESEGLRVCVHWNRCGCCVSVHEDVPHPVAGYIVGSDGRSDWTVTQ